MGGGFRLHLNPAYLLTCASGAEEGGEGEEEGEATREKKGGRGGGGRTGVVWCIFT